MDACCDLHTHSNFSDGTCTPAELIRLAEEAGISAIALCDHNTVAGLPSFLEAAQNSLVEAVSGIEFSTEYQGTELHILGLFLQKQHYGAINALLEEALHRKEQSNLALIEKLREQGLKLDYWKIREESSGANLNRAVIGAYLMRNGFCSTMEEAFDRAAEAAVNWVEHGIDYAMNHAGKGT